MKLALIISSMSLGGASRVMSLLANAWAERGDEIVLITLDDPRHDAFPVHPRVHRVGLDLMSDSKGIGAAIVNNWRRLGAVRTAIRESGAPVVLSFEDRMNVLVTVATLGMPLRRVVCERTDVRRHRIGRIWPLLRRMTYPLASGLVVQTRALLPWARSVMFGTRRVYVLPNPVPLESFSAGAPAPSALTIVSVGRLESEKGYDVLLRAFARIADEFENWSLVIAGDGSQRESLSAMGQALGLGPRVQLAGYVADPRTLLSEAAIFAMASRYEGFPNALLEAMAAGLPVISTSCTGSLELITDGADGLLVPVENADALANAMRRLMSDPQLRARLGTGALATARRYALPSVMPEWDALIASTCLPSSS